VGQTIGFCGLPFLRLISAAAFGPRIIEGEGHLKLSAISLLVAAAGVFGATAPKFSLADSSGAKHTDAEWRTARASVIFFITTDCPISNGYVPEMNRIAHDYSSRGVHVYAVMADTSTPLAEVQRHAKDFGFTFPVLVDPKQTLVRFTGASITPQAALISPAGSMVYLGRIDNRVEGFGQQRLQATQHELRDALNEVLAGKPVAKPATKAIGCSIVMGSGS
jgi:peroxiredoxin